MHKYIYVYVHIVLGRKTREVTKMTKLYQLMIGRRQVNDLYYDRDDAIENAKQLVRDTGLPVSVWVAEDIEGVSVDVLDWKHMAGMSRGGNGAVYYMRGYVMTEEGVIVLYAELPASYRYEAVYEVLREKILEQAVKQGVDVDSLVFYYD